MRLEEVRKDHGHQSHDHRADQHPAVVDAGDLQGRVQSKRIGVHHLVQDAVVEGDVVEDATDSTEDDGTQKQSLGRHRELSHKRLE